MVVAGFECLKLEQSIESMGESFFTDFNAFSISKSIVLAIGPIFVFLWSALMRTLVSHGGVQ